MNQLSTLLVVDPDPGGLKTLTYGFEREGWTVAGTSDPSLAPDLVRTTSPQLAVVSLRGPGRTGLEIISGLRGVGGANGRGLPVVTLGPADLKPDALAAGASDFLPTPLFVRDVISVGRLLTLREQVPVSGDAEATVEIHGRLSEYYGLFYLLRAIAVTGRSAILLMSRGNRKAELRFCDGSVMAVHVGSLQGLPALHSILLWDEAALSLKFRDVPKHSQISLSADELLEECERFLRDFAFNARDLGPPRTVYVRGNNDGNTAGLQPGQVGPVLRLFDGHRVLAEAIEESPFRVFDTLRVVKRLVDAGALRVLPETTAAPHPGPRSMMEQWAVAADPQGVPGERSERGRNSRRLKPLPGVGSAPIPLTVKKNAASGEISARKPAVKPRGASGDLANAPTVQIHLDGDGVPVAIPRVPVPPAPLTAREPSVHEPSVIIPSFEPPPVGPAAPAAEPPAAEAPPAATAPVVAAPEGPPVVIAPSLGLAPIAGAAAPAAALELQPTPPPVAQTIAPAPAPAPVAAAALASVIVSIPEAAALEAAPATAGVPQPSAEQPSARTRHDSKTRLKKVPTRITPTNAFDAVEADFFAREADLYKPQAVESFADLDPADDDPQSATGTAASAKKKKKKS